MPTLMDLIGKTLLRADGSSVETSSLTSDRPIIGLFFSASWCPPCQGFSGKLLDFYNKYHGSDPSKTFEVVQISSDRDEQGFQQFVQNTPWLSLPFVDRERKARLSKKFKVQSIPALVIVNGSTGQLITTDGRNSVLDDPNGELFPWHPVPLADKLQGELLSHMGTLTAEEAKARVQSAKVKGIFFSAYWCPPCRAFTPTLVDTYKKLSESGEKFEVIYASSDRSEDGFEEYHSTMPWLALPYKDSRIQELHRHFGVQGIPTLILVDENDEVLSTNGRSVIAKDTECKSFPWPPQPLNELNEITASRLNEGACLIYFSDGDESEIIAGQELLRDVAYRYCEEQKASRNTNTELPELCFLYEGDEAEDISESLRSLTGLDERSAPIVALLDIPEQQYYALPEKSTINAEDIQQIINQFKSYTLEYTQLNIV